MFLANASRNVFALCVCLLVLAAVGYSLSFGTLPPAVYTFVNRTEVKTLDPALATGTPEHRIISSVLEGLTSWEPENLKPVPGMAKSWDISDDKKTYTFHLRDNALWTDGTRVTADDFVYSWRRFLHPSTGAEYSYEMWYVVNAERFNKQAIEVGDRVEVELPRPAGPQDSQAAPDPAGEIVKGKLVSIERPADAARSQGDDSTDDRTGSGAQANGTVYVVETGGIPRRFQKGGKDGEDYLWILLDFDTVGVKALDPSILQVKLRHPVPYFLNLCGFYPYFPVNRHCAEEFGREWTKPANMVSNGPFRLQTRRLRDRIRLVKSETYWDRDAVRLNIVDCLAAESLTTSLNLYLTGQVDWIEYVPGPVVEELLAQNRPDFQPSPFITTDFYRLNVTEPPLNDARVRRALNMAMNKHDIVDRILKAGQKPARSIVPTAISRIVKYQPGLCEDYNVEKARALLAEAGYPGGRGFPRLEMQYNTNDTHSAVGELIQSQWQRALGIRIELKGLEWNVYQSNQSTRNYQISRAGWVGDYADPITFLKLWLSDSGQNQTGWANTQYDELVHRAEEEADDDRRADYYHQAETLLMHELPIIPVYHYVSTSMSKTYVKGYYQNLQDFHPIKYIWIDEDEKAQTQSEGKL